MKILSREGLQVKVCVWLLLIVFTSCQTTREQQQGVAKADDRIPVIFDTDANNELDDQHALAYLFFNQDVFNIRGITVNATMSGGGIDDHYAEALRIMKLCKVDTLPLLRGANKSYGEIKSNVKQEKFDGAEAVDFIIRTVKAMNGQKLTLLAVGKLTNVALALKKDSTIAGDIRLVWLGSNYPDPGEYNQDSDTASMNYVLKQPIAFEMVTVRYGLPSGTAAVKLLKEDALAKMPGLGPQIDTPITGRHGGTFTTFGDYSVNLFEHIDYDGTPPARALFDMAAVAIVKQPDWAQVKEIPAPVLIDNVWREQPNNKRKIKVWENFDSKAILDDFFKSFPQK